jgi:multiple sugar transport system substrate-binding protein
VLNSKGKYKSAAWRLIEYLSRTETQIRFYHLVYDLPARREAWLDPSIKDDPYMRAFYEQFQHVVVTPKITEWEQIAFSKLQQYAELAARGAMPIDEALNSLNKDVDKILEKRRWLRGKIKRE